MSRFLNRRYARLEAYVPGEQPTGISYIKLNTNESPYPPSEKVRLAAASARNLRLYSDLSCTGLRRKMASLYHVGEDNLFFASGSDDILSFAFAAFAAPAPQVAFPEISYGFYPVYADFYGLDALKVPLREDFSIHPSDYFGLNRFIVLANPNAPTGLLLSVSDIEAIVKSNPDHVVLIDEAYIDFGGESCCKLTGQYDNLLVVGTFSKSRSLAGARLGYAIGEKSLMEDLDKLRYSTNPYHVNSLTQAAAEAALADNDYFLEKCRQIVQTREAFIPAMRKLGFEVLPSYANFVLVRGGGFGGRELYTKLKQSGILIRHFDTDKLSDYNRITIGTPQEMNTLLQTIQKLSEEKKDETR